MSCVLFDLYGTLVDLHLDEDSPALWEGLAEALRQCGGTVGQPTEVRNQFRQILADEAQRGREGFLMEPTCRRLLAWAGARDEVAQLGRVFRRHSTAALSLRAYVRPLFEALRETACTLGIVSNTEAVLTRFDLDQYPILLAVDTIVLSSEVGTRKPEPEIFRIALDRLGVPASTAVFVGNSLDEDVVGAQRAGLRALYLDPAATRVRQVSQPFGSFLSVMPTLDALIEALGICGWHPVGTIRKGQTCR